MLRPGSQPWSMRVMLSDRKRIMTSQGVLCYTTVSNLITVHLETDSGQNQMHCVGAGIL